MNDPEGDKLIAVNDNFEAFMPNQIVKNFNNLVNEPQPVRYPSERSLKPPTETNIQNQPPLFTEKANSLRPINKQNSSDHDEQSKKKHSEDNSDVHSQRSHDNKKLRRLRSNLRQRKSVTQTNLPKQPNIISNIIESLPFSILMAIVTLYALFGDDIRVLSVTKSQDEVFYVLTIIAMSLFIIEILLNCITNPEYIGNFYFWLDSLSTISLILDIGWITDQWYGGDVTNAYSIKQISLASQAARKAGRVIRVIRLVRLVKLYKHARQQLERAQQRKQLQILIRQAQQKEFEKVKEQHNQNQLLQDPNQPVQSAPPQLQSDIQLSQPREDHDRSRQQSQSEIPIGSVHQISSEHSPSKGNSQTSGHSRMNHSSSMTKDQQMQMVKESQVGQKLSDLVMRRVITIILAILLSIPLLDIDTYVQKVSSYDSGLNRIIEYNWTAPDNKANIDNTTNKTIVQDIRKQLINKYVQFHAGEIYPIYGISIYQNDSIGKFEIINSEYQGFETIFSKPQYQRSEYRFTDLQYYIMQNNSQLLAYSQADLLDDNRVNSGLSIVQTIFVCLVLAISALVFNKDVSDLVIDPIEGMMAKIELIAMNPLEAANIEEQETLLQEEQEKNQDIKALEQRELEKSMETNVLQKIIMKIGALLAVGFGEAGAEIIAENIKQGGGVDPMIPGKKMMAVFGFCDIRNFTDATEVLQKDVMLFVNEIAEIVHSTVDSFGGSANKNIGDAFLLVWKFQPNEYHEIDKKLQLKTDPHIQQKCDMAVLSFLKTITSVATAKKLEKYKQHPGLQARMKDYSVKMGFGLHLGWAIEGAIGSTFKIDASYLSPNVNMASRLEAATKQFGSVILISGVLRKQLSDQCKKHLRMIDIVTVKGSIEPVEIHTVDISMKNLLAKIAVNDKFDLSHMSPKDQKKFRVLNRYKRNQLTRNVTEGKIIVSDQFKTDPELIAAREPYTEEFYTTWAKGFTFYIEGKWSDAQSIFQKTLTMIPEHKDGPSNTLLEVIHSYGGKAPHDWKGFRELTEK